MELVLAVSPLLGLLRFDPISTIGGVLSELLSLLIVSLKAFLEE